MTTNEKKDFLISSAYFGVWAILIFFSLKYALSLFLPFILGFAIAFMLKPAISYISEKLKIKRKYASLIAIALFYLVIVALFFLIGKRLIAQGIEFARAIPDIYASSIAPFFERLSYKISDLFPSISAEQIRLYSESLLKNIGDKATSMLTSAAFSLPEIIVSIFFSIISSAFISADYFKVTEALAFLIPKKYRGNLFIAKDAFVDTTFGMLKGYILIAIITFFELLIGFYLLKVEHALLFSAIISLLDILPIIGSGLFLVPYGIFSIMSGNIFLGSGTLILFGIISVVRNIIEPKIIGSKIGLNPILMLLSIYAGGKLFGFLGIFALPIAIIIAKKLYEVQRYEKSKL